MMLSEIQINIFSKLDRLVQRDYELITLSGILNELHGLLQNSRPKKRKKVEFALQFLKKSKIKILNEELLSNETIDEYIIRIAKKTNFIVATNDRNLRQKLRKEGIRVAYLRQRSHLVIDGYIG